MNIWKWTLRDLRNQSRIFGFFVFNLIIGLSGFITLNAFRSSISDSLDTSAKFILAADLAISTRRQFSTNELKEVRRVLSDKDETSTLTEFFSMMSSDNVSKLVQVRAIEPSYPFYGHLGLAKGGKILSKTSPLKEGSAVIYPELLQQLQLKVGKRFQLGESSFSLEDVIDEDTSQGLRMGSLSPRVYILRQDLAATKLIDKGSTVSETILVRLSDPSSLESTRRKFLNLFPDPAIRIETPQDASQDTGRVINYLSDYLGLVSLVGLFLSSLGCAFLYQRHLNKNLRNLALWNALGRTKPEVFRSYLLQAILAGLFAALVSLLLCYGFLPGLSNLLAELTPFKFQVTIDFEIMAIALVVGGLSSLAICWPFWTPVLRLPTSFLFSESARYSFHFQRKDFIRFVPAIGLFALLSFWQAHSFRIGGIFLGIFLTTLGILSLIGLGLIRSLSHISWKSWTVRHGIISLVRRPSTALISFVSIALSLFLLNLVPQIQKSLENEIRTPSAQSLPGFFLFDIQPEQVEPLQKFVLDLNLKLQNLSPMVRARLLSVNGLPFEKEDDPTLVQTREQENSARFRNRGFNLSYRDGNLPSEKIVAGKPSVPNAEPPHLGVEVRFAQRLGFSLGDILEFDIQGIPVKGQIQNLRSVKWNSFQPNFFVVFPTGVLEDSPQIFLANLPPMDDQVKNEVTFKISKNFPNISLIDIQRVVQRVLDLVQKMLMALSTMSGLCLATGLIVVFTMMNLHLASRRWDYNLMKILGAEESQVRWLLWIEFGSLIFAAILFGSGLSVLASFLVSKLIFDGVFSLNLNGLILYGAVGSILAFVMVWATSRRIIQEKPISILKGSE